MTSVSGHPCRNPKAGSNVQSVVKNPTMHTSSVTRSTYERGASPRAYTPLWGHSCSPNKHIRTGYNAYCGLVLPQKISDRVQTKIIFNGMDTSPTVEKEQYHQSIPRRWVTAWRLLTTTCWPNTLCVRVSPGNRCESGGSFRYQRYLGLTKPHLVA